MTRQQRPVMRVATLNLRNTADRWKYRASMLVDQMVSLQPDIIGLQEVRRPADQAEWIAEQVNARSGGEGVPYLVYQTNKSGLAGLVEGIAVMSRLPMLERDWLDLEGGSRVAQRVRVGLPDGGVLDFYNTHLHHEADAEELRVRQARRLAEWMAERPDAPQVLVGDMNARPSAPSIGVISERLRSAYAAAHGREPDRTFPTPLSEEYGRHQMVIDYIFVNGLVEVRDAWVAFDEVDPRDERLAASDHYGLAADISIQE